MAWIESHTVLIRHRKTISFALMLGIKPVEAVGYLTVFWHAVLEQEPSGDLSNWSDDFIASASHWTGDAAVFCSALRENGWLDGQIVHDWMDYAGRYLNSKYHTSNPRFLKNLRRRNKVTFSTPKGEPKGHLKVAHHTIPNQPNLTNHTNHKKQFDILWSSYPKKVGKDKAFSSFSSSVKTASDLEDMRRALDNYLKSERVLKGYIQDGSRWFRGWKDWVDYKESSGYKPTQEQINTALSIKKMEEKNEKRIAIGCCKDDCHDVPAQAA